MNQAKTRTGKAGTKVPEAAELQRKLADLLAELARESGRAAWEVDSFSRDLMLSLGGGRPRAQFPNGQGPSTIQQAEKELEAVRKAATALSDALNQLHAPAFRALTLNMKRDWLPQLKANVCILATVSPLTKNTITDADPDIVAVPRRKSKNNTLHDFALKLALYYEYTSGRTASIITDPDSGAKRGRYLDFVSAVFDIVGVDRRPVYWAELGHRLLKEHRQAAEEMQQRQIARVNHIVDLKACQ